MENRTNKRQTEIIENQQNKQTQPQKKARAAHQNKIKEANIFKPRNKREQPTQTTIT